MLKEVIGSYALQSKTYLLVSEREDGSDIVTTVKLIPTSNREVAGPSNTPEKNLENRGRSLSCKNGLLPDGPICPKCGKQRAPSGVDGGSWVHYEQS